MTPQNFDPRFARAYGHLIPGRRYRVARAFVDYDGQAHPAGETWRFLGHAFLPYDDGLSLFVTADDTAATHVRLQSRAEAQGEIVNHLEDYVAAII